LTIFVMFLSIKHLGQALNSRLKRRM
jgi:hypothetical protein